MPIALETAKTSQLRMSRNNIFLSVGTAFTVSMDNASYLVTALHNITGRDYFTNKCLNKNLALPNIFKLLAWTHGEKNGKLFLREFEVPMFSSFGPNFFYDRSAKGADIAVFPLPAELKISCFSMSAQFDWQATVGTDAVALGFPSAIDISHTCVWKRIMISSEPDIDVNGHNLTLTDGRTFSGMSGGPVLISQSSGTAGAGIRTVIGGNAVRLLGVYGGRYHTDKEKSDTLGFYWPIEVAVDLAKTKRQIGQIDLP